MTTVDIAAIPEAVLMELLRYARDEDDLDISDDEIRDGHHRISVYAEIARRAYIAGRASLSSRLNCPCCGSLNVVYTPDRLRCCNACGVTTPVPPDGVL